MVYLGGAYRRRCASMLTANRENSKSNYPFAVVAVNLVSEQEDGSNENVNLTVM